MSRHTLSDLPSPHLTLTHYNYNYYYYSSTVIH